MYSNYEEDQYLDLLELILDTGIETKDRTGVGTKSVFGHQMRFEISKDNFPLLTTKKVFFKSIVTELLWFLSGSTNVKDLHKENNHIWDSWADENGELGPVYGSQWRRWAAYDAIDQYEHLTYEIDQITNLVNGLKNNPNSRRHIVSAWNPADVPNMALPPCHCFFQCYVREGKLSLQLYQRSADMMLGVPFNIASYALLQLMLCQVCDLEPGEFIHTFGDAHIYLNHVEGAEEQLKRLSKDFPKLVINPDVKNIFEFKPQDFQLENYDPEPAIKLPIAV